MHKEQRRPFINLGPGTSAPELELELILQTPLFPILLSLWTPNLAGWWFRMKGIHLTQIMWSRVRSRNALSPHSQGPQSPKLGRVLNQDEGVSLKKSRDISIVWSREKSKTSYFLNHRANEMYKQSKNKHKNANWY